MLVALMLAAAAAAKVCDLVTLLDDDGVSIEIAENQKNNEILMWAAGKWNFSDERWPG